MNHHTIKISTLLDQLDSEEIQLPAIQRKYVWKRKQVQNLMDSIYKDYPTGNILLWETDVDTELRELAVNLDKNNKASRHFLLLDGQQRLTSLLTVIRGKPIEIKKGGKTEQAIIDLYFNLDHPTDVQEYSGDITDDEDDKSEDAEDIEHSFFQLKTTKIANKTNWVPVKDILNDQSTVIQNLDKEDPKYNEYIKRITKLQNLKENYSYDVVTLPSTMTYGEVTDVFVRVNSSGAKLRAADLALAQITSRWTDGLKIFEEFANSCYEENYDLSVNELLKMLVTVCTGQNLFKIINKTPIDDLKSSWNETKKAVNFTINFLKENASIESMKVIPSYFLLIPILYIAQKENYELSGKQSNLLTKWFFAAAMWGRYSVSSESTLDRDLVTIRDNDNYIEKMIANVTSVSGRLEVKPEDLEGQSVKSPFFMMSYVLARRNNARDWRTKNKVSLTAAGIEFKEEYDHIFPQAKLKPYLQKKNYDKSKSKALINDIANMAFLSKVSNIKKSDTTPDQYFPEKRVPDEDLIAQYITTDSTLWTIDRYEDFLEDRRKKLAAGINNLMNSLGS